MIAWRLLERRFREAHAGEPVDDRVVTWRTPIAAVAAFMCFTAAFTAIGAMVGLGFEDPSAMVPILAAFSPSAP